jgi:hypothetical protein
MKTEVNRSVRFLRIYGEEKEDREEPTVMRGTKNIQKNIQKYTLQNGQRDIQKRIQKEIQMDVLETCGYKNKQSHL